MPTIISKVLWMIFWAFVALWCGFFALWIQDSVTLYWVVAVAIFVFGLMVEFGFKRRRNRRGNGALGIFMVLALAAIAVALSAGSGTARGGIIPHYCYQNMSNWFGGSHYSQKWCEPQYWPPKGGCHSLDVWHTGRNVAGLVDYKFHLYVHWCDHRKSNGHYVWDSLSWHVAPTNLGSTAHYDGVTSHMVEHLTCQVGEQLDSPWQSGGCLKLIYHGQVAHSIPGLPVGSWPVGHPTVSVYINVDGNPAQSGYFPYWNDGQY